MKVKTQLKQIASYSKGAQINGDKLVDDGVYDYLNGGIAPSGKWNEFNTPGGTVTISEGGNSCGYVNYMREPFWCGAHCYYLYDTIQNSEYLYYALKSQQDRFMGIRTGACMPNIKKADLGRFEIMYDTDELQQEYVVSVLKKVEFIIDARQKELTELENLIKARFVEMFGDPIRNEKCWEQRPLSVCLESIDNGKSFVCDSAAREGDWPAVLKLSAATYGFYRPEENKAILDEHQFVEDAAVRAGDLLFTRKNTPELVGMCAYVYETPPGLMMPDLIFRLNTTERCNKVFLWKLINHNLFRECIRTIATGSAKSMSNISKERLLNLEIILPPIELQNQFASFVEQTDKSKVVVQKVLETIHIV